MELQRVHAQRLCASCADKAEAQPTRPSSGKLPKAPTARAATVSRTPLVLMGASVVILAGVAVYFTVLAPGAGGDPSPAPTPAPAGGEVSPPPDGAPPVVPLPPPIRTATDLTFEGTLQPWEPDPANRGNPKFLAFVDTLAGRELRITHVDKYIAGDCTVGNRYRVSYRDIPDDGKVVSTRYTAKTTKIDPIK
jgi:hypothetical protein